MRAAERAERDSARAAELAARNHDAHVVLWRRLFATANYRLRYRTDPDFRLKECLRRQLRKKTAAVPGADEMVRAALRRGSASPTFDRVFGYGATTLRRHLERQFLRGMSWANFGKTGWHIDHILPKRCFELSRAGGLRAYWALTNLRPLWAAENLRKSARIEFLC